MNPARAALRDRLYATLRGRGTPMLVAGGFATPAASIWTGARAWINALRSMGLAEGDRVVVALPRTPAHAMGVLACWWEGLAVCLADPDGPDLTRAFGARLILGVHDLSHALGPDSDNVPDEAALPRPLPGVPAPPGTALVESPGGRVWTFADVLAHLTARGLAAAPEPEGELVASLPWHSADGLLGELWPALLSGAIVRADDPAPARGRSRAA